MNSGGITGITWGMTYWPYWILATTLSFGIAETIALITNPRNTLSDFCWREFGFPLNGPIPSNAFTAAWFFSLGAWLVVAFFLTQHIWFEKFR